MKRDWGRVKETDTTDDFVKSQGIVYVICPRHDDGYQYIRYIIIGYMFISDPEGKHFMASRKAFPHHKQVYVFASCSTCQRRLQ